MTRTTRTLAILKLSPAAYDEIRKQLEAAEYDHAIGRDGVLDMHGIGIALDDRPRHYPPGMQAESQRLHREYSALVEAQRNGAKNSADVVRLTDEAAAKGIILVPGGENL